jgi:hypothetical protein
VTVLRGSRASLLREQARRELVECAVETTDGREYLEILRAVAPEDWHGFWAELVLRVGVPIVSEYVAHLRGPESRSQSRRSFVHVVQPAEHWARAGHADPRAGHRFGRVQAERPMGALPVVVRREFGQERAQVRLVYDDQPVEALSAQGADQPFGDGVRPGRPDRREQRLGAEPARPPHELRP